MSARKRILVVSLPLFAGVWLTTKPILADPSRPTIRVMTYNIGGYAPPLVLQAPQMAQIAQEIKTAQADVVGMTEIDVGTRNGTHPYFDMLTAIDTALDNIDYPMELYFKETVYYAGGYGGMAIWSRFPIVSTGYVPTWTQDGSFRKVSRATIEFASDCVVHCFMTHYALQAESYQPQTDTILSYTESFSGPCILMGDMNFGPTSSYYNQYIAAGWQDSCVAAGQTDCLTVGVSAGLLAPDRIAQIDFIFGTGGVNFTEAYVPDSTVSDHWPLVAGFDAPLTVPTIVCLPTEITVEVMGGTPSHVEPLELTNGGTAVLNYTLSDNADWLQISPTTGISTNEIDLIDLTFLTGNLEANTYTGSITITDPAATDPSVVLPVNLTVRVPGDLDGDSDVDQTDFGLFQTCVAGTGTHQDNPDCRWAHLDDDADVDQLDFGLFQRCMTGAGVPGSAHCAAND